MAKQGIKTYKIEGPVLSFIAGLLKRQFPRNIEIKREKELFKPALKVIASGTEKELKPIFAACDNFKLTYTELLTEK